MADDFDKTKWGAREPGRPPGTFTGEVESQSKVRVIAYDAKKTERVSLEALRDASSFADGYDVVWIDVIGARDADRLRELGDVFDVHPLSLEDVANLRQRAKVDPYDGYTYYVTRMVSGADRIASEQLSIFHVGKFVITFQEHEGDCLNPIRKRIAGALGFIRERPSDYLVYAIIDTVIDHYFPIVDGLRERLDEMDAQLLRSDGDFSIAEIHRIRTDLLNLGRWLRPHREMINQLLRDKASTMSAETQLFMRDCYDHVIRLSESIETCRETCSDLRAYHLSVVSNRTNDVMKTLTIVSSIFIPLGFIAGLYGMNFQNMPELRWQYGYAFVIALMISVASGLLFWFHRRGWFNN